MSGRRLYLGRLPPDTRPEDVQKHFDGYGKISECRVMTGFGFVEFENSKDADDVVQAFNGKPLMGQSIIVEFAKDSRRRDDRDYGRPPPPRMARKPNGVRVTVSGISRDTSWQDLKDFGREAGSVTFADVDRDGRGVLEYLSQEDADHAVRTLEGKDLRGVSVRLALDEERGTFRRSPPRRDRSRSPHGRRDERERRRSRSPRRYEERRDDREYYKRDDRRDDRRERDRGGYDDRERRDDDRFPPPAERR